MQLKKSYEYFLVFNKEVFYNKLSYVWSLVLPMFFIIVYNISDRTSMTYTEFSEQIYFYWSLMVLITAAEGIGVGILNMRDYNFLKMYTYISGDKAPIVLGKIQSQSFFLMVNILMFTTVSGIIYSQPIISLLLTGVIVSIIVAIPIYFLFLITTTIRLKANGVGPILYIVVLVLINLASVTMNTNTWVDNLVYLNPALIIGGGASNIHSILLGLDTEYILYTSLSLLCYCIIGWMAYRKLDIVTRVGR